VRFKSVHLKQHISSTAFVVESFVHKIRLRSDHSIKNLWYRTIAAQLHLLALLLTLVASSVLMLRVASRGNALDVAGCAIFCLAAMLLFGLSALNHLLSDGFVIGEKFEAKLVALDRVAIYLLIAGSYTPVLLHIFLPPTLNVLLAIIWGVAAVGILFTMLMERLPHWAQRRGFSTVLFVLMGWTALFKVSAIFAGLSVVQRFELISMGLSYTIGAVVYALKRPRLFPPLFGYHELWHAMVMVGFTFHYFLVLSFFS
jgi:hemolysin III